MRDVKALVRLLFSGLSPLVVDEVKGDGELIRVRAQTPAVAVACRCCGRPTARVHGYHERAVSDVPIDARQVVVKVRMRRLVCPAAGCHKTFREQVPGVLERYQRRTCRLSSQIGVVVRELAGRAAVLWQGSPFSSRGTPHCVHCRGCRYPKRQVPRVLGVDDFALRKRQRYATILIDAQTRQRIDVLPDRLASTVEQWLRAHPGVEIV